ncbi:MAG: hypothetical protein J6C41_01035 [Oscillospiraceae bacterium]|nr:hypothetical protein [Oscillospiraceae bacterium]
MANNDEEKVKHKRKRQIKGWDTYTLNLNSAMLEADYLQEWINIDAPALVGDLFPGESKDWIAQLSNKWREKKDKNQFSLQALKIFCEIEKRTPNEVLGVHTESQSNNALNSKPIYFLKWNDIVKIVNMINADTPTFCSNYKPFPILIPVVCNFLDLLLVCLKVDRVSNNIVKYEMINYNLPEICGFGGDDVEKIRDFFMGSAILSSDKDCLKKLEVRYKEAAKEFRIFNGRFSDSFDEINRLISELSNGIRPSFQGCFFNFCPQASYYQAPQSLNLDDLIDRSGGLSSSIGGR